VDPERGFIAMELIEGESLAAKLGGRPLPVEKAIGLAVQSRGALVPGFLRGVHARPAASGGQVQLTESKGNVLRRRKAGWPVRKFSIRIRTHNWQIFESAGHAGAAP
jgi:hypothetical protein